MDLQAPGPLTRARIGSLKLGESLAFADDDEFPSWMDTHTESVRDCLALDDLAVELEETGGGTMAEETSATHAIHCVLNATARSSPEDCNVAGFVKESSCDQVIGESQQHVFTVKKGLSWSQTGDVHSSCVLKSPNCMAPSQAPTIGVIMADPVRQSGGMENQNTLRRPGGDSIPSEDSKLEIEVGEPELEPSTTSKVKDNESQQYDLDLREVLPNRAINFPQISIAEPENFWETEFDDQDYIFESDSSVSSPCWVEINEGDLVLEPVPDIPPRRPRPPRDISPVRAYLLLKKEIPVIKIIRASNVSLNRIASLESERGSSSEDEISSEREISPDRESIIEDEVGTEREISTEGEVNFSDEISHESEINTLCEVNSEVKTNTVSSTSTNNYHTNDSGDEPSVIDTDDYIDVGNHLINSSSEFQLVNTNDAGVESREIVCELKGTLSESVQTEFEVVQLCTKSTQTSFEIETIQSHSSNCAVENTNNIASTLETINSSPTHFNYKTVGNHHGANNFPPKIEHIELHPITGKDIVINKEQGDIIQSELKSDGQLYDIDLNDSDQHSESETNSINYVLKSNFSSDVIENLNENSKVSRFKSEPNFSERSLPKKHNSLNSSSRNTQDFPTENLPELETSNFTTSNRTSRDKSRIPKRFQKVPKEVRQSTTSMDTNASVNSTGQISRSISYSGSNRLHHVSQSAPLAVAERPPSKTLRGEFVQRLRLFFASKRGGTVPSATSVDWDEPPAEGFTEEDPPFPAAETPKPAGSLIRRLSSRSKKSSRSFRSVQNNSSIVDLQGNGVAGTQQMTQLVDYEGLIDLFRCIKCLLKLSPPLLQCRKGHLICSVCRAGAKHVCPSCKQRFASESNVMMEEVYNLIRRPCRWTDYGCHEYRFPVDLPNHETYCPTRPLHCQYATSGCKKMLSLREMKTHLQECPFQPNCNQ